MGATPSNGLPDRRSPDEPGRNPQKGTHPREVCSVLPLPENLRPRLIGYSGWRGRRKFAPVTLSPKNRIRLRSSICGWRRKGLRLWRGFRSARSPLPRFRRL